MDTSPNALALVPPDAADLLPRMEDLIVLPFGYPTEATAPLRRVLDNAHPEAARLLVDYLTAAQPNRHTREAYKRALCRFFVWLDHTGLGLRQAKPHDLHNYMQGMSGQYSFATMNQHLAAIRGFYQYLRERTDFDANPAAEVKGQRTGDREGKTPYLPSPETQKLLDAIPLTDINGYRDRALIGTMVYTFTRISAALSLKVKDYFIHGGNHHLKIVGKRNVHRLIPVHPLLNTYLAAYLDMASIREQKDVPLFQTAPYRRLSGNAMGREAALKMVKHRAEQAGIESIVCNHTFRAVGITAYLESDGAIEKAAHYAGHASTRTTQIYDRRRDIGSADDIARTRL